VLDREGRHEFLKRAGSPTVGAALRSLRARDLTRAAFGVEHVPMGYLRALVSPSVASPRLKADLLLLESASPRWSPPSLIWLAATATARQPL